MSVLQNRKAAAGLSILVDFIAHLDEYEGVVEEIRAAQVAADEALSRANDRHNQNEAEARDLTAREKNVASMEAAARNRAGELDASWKQLAIAKQGFVEFQKDAQAELDEHDDLLRAREQELNEREKWINNAASELGKREKDLDDREAGMKRIEADLQSREADYRDRLTKLKALAG